MTASKCNKDSDFLGIQTDEYARGGERIEALETKNPEREYLSGLIALIDPATTYFPTTRGSIIGAKELDDRVRNGIGYGLFAVITGFIKNL